MRQTERVAEDVLEDNTHLLTAVTRNSTTVAYSGVHGGMGASNQNQLVPQRGEDEQRMLPRHQQHELPQAQNAILQEQHDWLKDWQHQQVSHISSEHPKPMPPTLSVYPAQWTAFCARRRQLAKKQPVGNALELERDEVRRELEAERRERLQERVRYFTCNLPFQRSVDDRHVRRSTNASRS
jgi:hypothetical protein